MYVLGGQIKLFSPSCKCSEFESMGYLTLPLMQHAIKGISASNTKQDACCRWDTLFAAALKR